MRISDWSSDVCSSDLLLSVLNPQPMARTSPGVQRIVSILNFFADHPEQSFTLTDLVRALKLSRATCHALLTGLVEAGYLDRSHDKSFVLGATLAPNEIGRASCRERVVQFG